MANKAHRWRERSLRWTQGRVGQPFEWGKTDCGSLVRKMAGIMYLENVFPDVPTYNSLKEAKKVWDETGGTAQQLKQIGATEVQKNFVRACDIIITSEDEFDFEAAMIYVNSGFLASSVDYGVRLLKRKDLPEHYVLRLPNEVN